MRAAFVLGLVTLLLAGCGGSPPIGAPGAMPQRSAIAQHAPRGKSWVLPEAKAETLVYATAGGGSTVEIFSYPKGKLVGVLTGFSVPASECSDEKGNVWIVNSSSASFVEYAHGGNSPIATLYEPKSYIPIGCSVDPTSGDLAATNEVTGDIAVFHHASGAPVYYSNPDFPTNEFCSYDNTGNLFAASPSTGKIIELPSGESELRVISIDQNIGVGSLQWAGTYLAIVDRTPFKGPTVVDHVSIAGSQATVIGQTTLGDKGRQVNYTVQFWIHDGTIVGPGKKSLNYWRYPKGGSPTKIIHYDHEQFQAVTMSVPSQR